MPTNEIEKLAERLEKDEADNHIGLAMVRIMGSLNRKLGRIENEMPDNGKLRLRLLEIFIYGAVGIMVGAVFRDMVQNTLTSVANLF